MIARAVSTRHGSRRMNGLERAYADRLRAAKATGTILDYRFEPMRLRLADGAWYTPDFGVVCRNQEIELHEVKGFWREAAKVRIKVAAELYPWFRFVVIRRARNRWTEEPVLTESEVDDETA